MFAIVAVALVLILAGCSSSEPSSSTTSAPTTTPAAATTGDEVIAVDIQGHRGARGLQPENTLPGFETALDLGVTTLELDLHFTSDGHIVVWHDPVIDSDKCGLVEGSGPDPDDPLVPDEELMISRLTLEQLGAYYCDRNPDKARFPDQRTTPTALAQDNYLIPSLASVFDFVAVYAESPDKTADQRAQASEVEFNIETKRKPDNPDAIGDGFDGKNAGPFELAILELIDEYELGSRVVIQSFDHRSIWAVHAQNPDIRLAALTTRQRPDLDEYAAKGATIWSPNQNDVTDDRIAEAHELGLLVIPWTVNDPDDMAELLKQGVDGIITDRPDLALSL